MGILSWSSSSTASSSSSCLKKLFSDSNKYYGDRDRKGLFFPKDSAEICFLRPTIFHKQHVVMNLCFPTPKTLYRRTPIFAISSLSSSHAQAQVQTEETEINEIISQSKTVCVKFQLERECSFGQQFFIVGDDPMFGLWEPSDAVPLNWSDGHVWTAELDIPTGKCIKYKIILKDREENIIWQPGPDRTLQTWGTQKTITVCEDWDDAELQKILEEEQISGQNEEININAENISEPEVEFHIDTKSSLPDAISDEDMQRLILETNVASMDVQDTERTTDEGDTLSMNGMPLLVPGLSPMPTAHTEETSMKEVETSVFIDASLEADNVKELNVPELNLEVLDNDRQEQHSCEQDAKPELVEDQGQENSQPVDEVLQNDVQWGRRTLQKFLANFGFESI